MPKALGVIPSTQNKSLALLVSTHWVCYVWGMEEDWQFSREFRWCRQCWFEEAI
ncbi:hypothetical protein I79_010410 [Cricetulus griseus]|uniref:Uncharacterized protein n=1 Tax=Cricetulus griseus TaxID=10029 RepID=G3HIE9_CRIGR|nr:hypothetical protein I79_010410 [Cricetulus griseus]